MKFFLQYENKISSAAIPVRKWYYRSFTFLTLVLLMIHRNKNEKEVCHIEHVYVWHHTRFTIVANSLQSEIDLINK